MDSLYKFERILRGRFKIHSDHDTPENKLLLLANHMCDSRETDPITLTAVLCHLCAQNHGTEAIKLMLETTAVDVNRSCASYDNNYYRHYSDTNDRTMPPLHIAIEHDNLDTVRLLLQQNTPLRIKQGRKRLKRQPINVNIKSGTRYVCSPLLRATGRAAMRPTQLEIIKLLLLQQGIDARITDSNGDTPLLLACYGNNLGNICLLLEHDKSLINDDDRPLLLACNNYRYDVMHYILHNADIIIEANIINLVGSDGNTALHMVISKNRNGGSTPLHAALTKRDYEDSKH
jgi:ankyrin repeat protein